MPDLDHDLEDFDVLLSPTGEQSSAFRTRNDPLHPHQRQNVIDRTGALAIRCTLVDVIHGKISEVSTIRASVIVLQFRFDPHNRTRRFKRAKIELHFTSSTTGRDPEVSAVEPSGRLSVAPSLQHEESKLSGSLQAGASAPIAGATLVVSAGKEQTISRDTSDYATVIGSATTKYRSYGEHNCANWTLLENPGVEEGIPPALRVAILLKRTDDEPFQCTVKVDADIDFRTRMERVFGVRGTDVGDDPVLFDPSIAPTNNHLQTYDVNGLGGVKLNMLSDITVRTTVTGTEKNLDQGLLQNSA